MYIYRQAERDEGTLMGILGIRMYAPDVDRLITAAATSAFVVSVPAVMMVAGSLLPQDLLVWVAAVVPAAVAMECGLDVRRYRIKAVVVLLMIAVTSAWFTDWLLR